MKINFKTRTKARIFASKAKAAGSISKVIAAGANANSRWQVSVVRSNVSKGV